MSKNVSHKQANNNNICWYKQDNDQRKRLNCAVMWSAGFNLVSFNIEAVI